MSKKVNKNVRERRELHIPTGSSLAPFVRRGKEGTCLSCGQPISAHFGRRNQWLGCKGDQVPKAATFVLVPVSVAAPVSQAADRAIVARKATWGGKRAEQRAVAAATPQQRFLYEASDRRVVLKGASPAMQDAYNALVKAKKPVDAVKAAKLAKRPTEANRRCLNQLTEEGLVMKHAQ